MDAATDVEVSVRKSPVPSALRLGNQTSLLVRDGKSVVQSSGFQKRGLQISSISVARELTTNANSWAPPLLNWGLGGEVQQSVFSPAPQITPYMLKVRTAWGQGTVKQTARAFSEKRTHENRSKLLIRYLRFPNKMCDPSPLAQSEAYSQRAHIQTFQRASQRLLLKQNQTRNREK